MWNVVGASVKDYQTEYLLECGCTGCGQWGETVQ